jgi:hypothetical protein
LYVVTARNERKLTSHFYGRTASRLASLGPQEAFNGSFAQLFSMRLTRRLVIIDDPLA